MAKSPLKRGAPLPSTTVPPLMTRSCVGVSSCVAECAGRTLADRVACVTWLLPMVRARLLC
jgi:hypothetical protein